MSPWDKLLEIVGSLVSPDWSALILLVPLGVLVLGAGYLLWVIRRFATAGPTVSRPLPTAPTPAGLHMPGPSLAPFLVAGGAFAFLLATLFIRVEPAIDPGTGLPIPNSTTVVIEPLGILALAVGLVAMIVALLYWGREANREYHALQRPAALPAVAGVGAPVGVRAPASDGVAAGVRAPAGVHVPGPSFRPLLAAISAAALLLGLVIDPVVFVAGILMTVIGLLGWLTDARKEYREVEKADATGHLENIPAPRFPTGTLIVFAALFVGSLLIAGGVIPPRGGTSGGSGASSPAPSSVLGSTPAPPGAPPGSTPAPSGAPSAAPSDGGGATVTLALTAAGIAYDTDTLAVPADTPFRIVFVNNDAGIPHNVAIHRDSPTGPLVWEGDIFNGIETRTYEVPALPAGTYGFACTVHPTMTGTLTAK